MSRPGTALNGDAPKTMVAKRLGFQAKEEEESQGAIQQLNTNVRTLVKCQGCRMNAKAAVPRLQVAFRDICQKRWKRLKATKTSYDIKKKIF